MSRIMQRDSYENLIKQIVYVEENMDEISSEAADAGFFASGSKAREFFGDYIGKVESLFKDLKIVEKEEHKHDVNLDSLPFIVLDSSFTLTARGGGRDFCHMSYGVPRECKGPVKHIYFLSKTGLGLLLKSTGERVKTDVGEGPDEYKITSITIK